MGTTAHRTKSDLVIPAGYAPPCGVQEVPATNLEGLRSPHRAGAGRRAQGRTMPVSDERGSCLETEVTVVSMTAPTPDTSERSSSAGCRPPLASVGSTWMPPSWCSSAPATSPSPTATAVLRGRPNRRGRGPHPADPPNSFSTRFRLGARVNDEVAAIERTAHIVTTRSAIDGKQSVVPDHTAVPPIPILDFGYRIFHFPEESRTSRLTREDSMDPRGLPDGSMAVRGPIWWEPVLTP